VVASSSTWESSSRRSSLEQAANTSMMWGMSTYYCELDNEGCDGGACYGTMVLSKNASTNPNTYVLPDNVDGIAAVDLGRFASSWNVTAGCSKCYKIYPDPRVIPSNGKPQVVQVTDKCGGYPGAATCVSVCCQGPWNVDHCATRIPPGTGNCKTGCDWCAAGDHPHFDLDIASFRAIFGVPGVDEGSGVIQVEKVLCLYKKANITFSTLSGVDSYYFALFVKNVAGCGISNLEIKPGNSNSWFPMVRPATAQGGDCHYVTSGTISKPLVTPLSFRVTSDCPDYQVVANNVVTQISSSFDYVSKVQFNYKSTDSFPCAAEHGVSCNSHGTCQSGQVGMCNCNSGWQGDFCNIPAQ